MEIGSIGLPETESACDLPLLNMEVVVSLFVVNEEEQAQEFAVNAQRPEVDMHTNKNATCRLR